MAIYNEFSHKKWWFSIVTLVYQRVSGTCLVWWWFSDRQMYEMGEQIGSGTFGTVWRAKHSQPGDSVRWGNGEKNHSSKSQGLANFMRLAAQTCEAFPLRCQRTAFAIVYDWYLVTGKELPQKAHPQRWVVGWVAWWALVEALAFSGATCGRGSCAEVGNCRPKYHSLRSF